MISRHSLYTSSIIVACVAVLGCETGTDHDLQRVSETVLPGVRLFDSAGAITARYPEAKFEEYRGLAVMHPQGLKDFDYLLFRFDVTETGVGTGERPTQVWAIADSGSTAAVAARMDSTLRHQLGVPLEGCAGAIKDRQTEIRIWHAGQGLIVLQTAAKQSRDGLPSARLYVLPSARSPDGLFPDGEYRQSKCEQPA